MRTENSIINASVGLIGQIISSIMNFICRTVFLYTFCAESGHQRSVYKYIEYVVIG